MPVCRQVCVRACCVNEYRAAEVCTSLLRTLLLPLPTRSPRSLTTPALLTHSRTPALPLARAPTIGSDKRPLPARDRNLDTAQAKGASVNQHDQYDRTPLHFAAFNGHIDAVKWLIEKKADVNVAVSSIRSSVCPLFLVQYVCAGVKAEFYFSVRVIDLMYVYRVW